MKLMKELYQSKLIKSASETLIELQSVQIARA